MVMESTPLFSRIHILSPFHSVETLHPAPSLEVDKKVRVRGRDGYQYDYN